LVLIKAGNDCFSTFDSLGSKIPSDKQQSIKDRLYKDQQRIAALVQKNGSPSLKLKIKG